MTKEYFAVTVIHYGKLSTKIAYTKHVFNNELEAMENCQKLQRTPNLKKNILNFGFEPITEGDMKRVESGETVYL